MVGAYSVAGADLCGDLPKLGTQIENGTSFAAPMFAAHMKEFLQLYGNVLSFEEILAGAMLTADTKLLDFKDAEKAAKVSFSDPRLEPRDYGALDKAPAIFRVNGGGLPWHERCGAGRYEKERWQAALDRMVSIKSATGHPAAEFSQFIPIDPEKAALRVSDGGGGYIYSLTVPEDLTLLKQEFLLPQFVDGYSDADVVMPSGFRLRLPRSSTDTVPTSAFAYEDVRKGDVIQIITAQPLAPTAGIQLRGFKPGNTIQALRDLLRAEGKLPKPLTVIGSENTALLESPAP
jgi:hypothetical protein